MNVLVPYIVAFVGVALAFALLGLAIGWKSPAKIREEPLIALFLAGTSLTAGGAGLLLITAMGAVRFAFALLIGLEPSAADIADFNLVLTLLSGLALDLGVLLFAIGLGLVLGDKARLPS